MQIQNKPDFILEYSMNQEILKNETTRTFILFWVFIGSTLSNFGLFFIPKEVYKNLFGTLPLILFILPMFIIALFFLFMWCYLKNFQKNKKKLPYIIRYINAFIETLIPTILGFLFIISASSDNFETFLEIRTFPIFIFLIILASMRMDFWICLFTGLVSMLEYSFLGIYSVLLKDIAFNNIQFPISITNHITLALYCLIGSLLTGLVTIDIKKRVNNSFKYIDERNMFLNMFGQHVSPEVVEKLISHKTEQVSEIRNVCVMFLDIRNFTKFSENKDPEYIVNYLNILFDSMIEIISRNNGIINKFLGDGFMAIFGAPLSSGNDSLNAVHSAVEIIRDIEIKNKNGIIQETNVGIGIHYGKVLTGHIGSSKRKEYTIIGDTVNLASRIEGLNKQYNSKILISEDVYSQVKESITQISFMEEVFVKGKEKPIRIYRLD